MARRAMIALAALLAALWLFTGACAAEGTVMLAEVGYGGALLSGRWMPLEVEITSQRAISGMLSVDVYQESDRYDTVQMPVELAAGETVRVHMPILALIPQRRFDVTLTADDGSVTRARAAAAREIARRTIAVGVLGDPTEELTQALRVTLSRDPLQREEMIETVALSEKCFPHDAREMAAFNVIVLDAFDVSTLTAQQQTLLKDWLLDGGLLIAGAGDGETHSLGWLGEITGIQLARQTPAIGGLNNVLAYAGMVTVPDEDADGETADEMTLVYPLDKPMPAGTRALVDAGGANLLAISDCGKGCALTAGFGLTQPQVLEAARDALWQRILLEAYPKRYNDMASEGGYAGSNTRFNDTMTNILRVSRGVSLLPAAALLAAYVLLAGAGLYLLMKRRDRSAALWALIPLASVACVALVAALSAALDLNEPAAASLTVAHYDERGDVTVQETVSIAYPQQTRARIEAANGSRVEREKSWYFSSYAEAEEPAALRDRITLGERPALELPPYAPWLAQDLVVLDAAAPQGRVTGRAWMEEDGLHASFVNDTPATLRDAILLTQLGYAHLGDIAPGGTADAFLARNDGPVDRKETGEERILPGRLLASTQSVYRVMNACVYPEREEDEAFTLSSLGEQERYRRSVFGEIDSLAQTSIREKPENAVGCVLAAKSDALAATGLLLDGAPVTRTAHEGIVLSRAAFETVGPTGVFYYPEGVFPARKAALAMDGTPFAQGETEGYYVSFSSETVLGFSLDGIDATKVTRLRVVHRQSDVERFGMTLSAYDHADGTWTPLDLGELVDLEGETARRLLGEAGELFLRYSAAGESVDLSIPEIVVEGSEAI